MTGASVVNSKFTTFFGATTLGNVESKTTRNQYVASVRIESEVRKADVPNDTNFRFETLGGLCACTRLMGLIGGLRLAIAVVVSVAALLGPVPSSFADTTFSTSQTSDFTANVDERLKTWSETLGSVERGFQSTTVKPRILEIQRLAVREVADIAKSTVAQLQEYIAPLQAQLNALGAGGGTDSASQNSDLDDMRATLSEQIAAFESRRLQVESLSKRADSLVSILLERQRASLWDQLTAVGPMPWLPSTIVQSWNELVPIVDVLLGSPQEWWYSLLPEQRDNESRRNQFFSVMAFVVLVAMILPRWLASRLGRDPRITKPGYARRLIAAIIEAGRRGVFPAFALLGLAMWSGREGTLLSGVFADVVIGVMAGSALYLAARSLLDALLAPQAPAWAIMTIETGRVSTFVARARFLSMVLAFDIGISLATQSVLISVEALAVFAILMTTAEAIGIWLVTDPRIWFVPLAPEERDDDHISSEKIVTDGKVEHGLEYRIWMVVRRIVMLTALVSVAAGVIGYATFSRFVIENTLITAGLIGGLTLGRGVLREVIGIIVRSRIARRRLGMSARFARRTKFWIRAALDPIVLIFSIYLILPLWGLPRDTLHAMAGKLTGEMEIGSVLISPVAIITAVIAFFLVMAATKILRGRFLTPVLAETRLDPGVRAAFSSGVGYIGALIALLVSVTVAGFDLTNLAIVAGALSVGIGFGLQGIVNNFLSGLILLIERPIKVGDWVVIGEVEGFVKDINFRATEIETWQRASVMVPNGDVISSSVTNWTHRNSLARIEVRIGVSFDADFDQVRDIMLACGKDHPKVLRSPEPVVLFMTHGEDRAQFELRVFTGEALWMLFIASDIRFAISKALKEAGIDMPLPQRIIRNPDGDEVTRIEPSSRESAPRPSSS